MNPAALQITRSDQHRRDISRCGTADAAASQVKKYYKTAQARGLDYVEARFWMGAAVAQYQLLSKRGDGVVKQLAAETGISPPFLYESLRLFDSFGGKFDRLYSWATGFMRENGSLMARDVKQLVSANTERSDLAREVRKHNGVTGEDLDLEDVNPPEVQEPEKPMVDRRQVLKRVREAIYAATYEGEVERQVQFEQGGQRFELTIRRLP